MVTKLTYCLLEVKTRNLTTPLLIIFKQNYEQSWILLNGLGISRDEHVVVDGNLNGYLIWLSDYNVSFSIFYSVPETFHYLFFYTQYSKYVQKHCYYLHSYL